MQHQGPNGMGGPLRGTSVWWHGRTGEAEPDINRDDRTEHDRTEHDRTEHDPTIRMELVARVRREIAAGDYDTQERWEAALDRLLDRLNRE